MAELLNSLEKYLKRLFNVIPGYDIHKDKILDIVFKLKVLSQNDN